MAKRWALLIPILLMGAGWVAGTAWRAAQLTRGLEYDEIWTLTHYVPKPWSALVFDLATPNNHPLHTVFAAWTLDLGQGSLMSYRMPSFAAGVVVMLLTPLLAWRLTRSVWPAAACALLVAGNGALAHFAVVARGYSLQTALLLLAAIFAMRSGGGPVGRDRLSRRLFWIVPAFLAVLTLPTTLLFLPGLCLAAWAAESAASQNQTGPAAVTPSFRRPSVLLALGVMLLGAACLYWLWHAWLPLSLARARFSQPFAGPWEHVLYGWRALELVGGTWPLTLLAASWLGWGRAPLPLRLAVGANVVLPWIGMAVVGVGPERAWLPVIPWLLAAAAAGFDHLATLGVARCQNHDSAPVRGLLWGGLGMVVLLTAGHARDRWTAPDWAALAQETRRACPANVLVVWPATSGYCIRFQAGTAAVADQLARLAAPTRLLQLGSATSVSAADHEGGEVWIPVPGGDTPAEAMRRDVPAACWGVTPQALAPEAMAATEVLLGVVPPGPAAERSALARQFLDPAAGNWRKLNLWLDGALTDRAGNSRTGSAWITTGQELRTPQAAAWCQDLAGRGVRFYRLTPIAATP